jgi:hypothetical protein
MQIFDTLPDNLVATLSIDELISKLYCGSDRDFKIAALLQTAKTEKQTQGKKDYDQGYDDGYEHGCRGCFDQ